ncbi:MAG TPA: peptidoglycan editing factor PgeF [bacterium]|nr:peptidoglycan editing factor PgeF [bacterium]
MSPQKSQHSDHLQKCSQQAAHNAEVNVNQIVCMEQVHSNNVQIVKAPGIYEQTDGVITQKTDLVLCIQTADCAPIFLFDPDSRTIAALHGGWRGISKDIISNAVKIMENDFNVEPGKLISAVGPSLRSCCFEVGEDVLHHFDENFVYRMGKQYYLKFVELIKSKLKESGIKNKNIDIINFCTQCNTGQFFSYRGDDQNTGRMINMIAFRR